MIAFVKGSNYGYVNGQYRGSVHGASNDHFLQDAQLDS